MKKLMYRLEEIMEIGGIKKDIALLIIGGISLILSLINSRGCYSCTPGRNGSR